MSAGTFEAFDALVRARAEALVAELKDLVRLPTVSVQQPPDPLDEWETPPFEPTERAGYLSARGDRIRADGCIRTL